MKSICVYCGSSPGRTEVYAKAARSLAEALVARGIRLVYGGASVGLMGLVADAVLEQGGEAIGVIPEALMRKEVAHPKLSALEVTPSMHARKMRMAELSDGFIALPGGVGTLEELFEIWTWGQLGFHRKPCGLLNVAGYYSGLTHFLDHTVEERFVKPQHRAMLMVEEDPQLLLERFAAYVPPSVPKWVSSDET
jgi:uncharacterized protein (TIGR00730 family)